MSHPSSSFFKMLNSPRASTESTQCNNNKKIDEDEAGGNYTVNLFGGQGGGNSSKEL